MREIKFCGWNNETKEMMTHQELLNGDGYYLGLSGKSNAVSLLQYTGFKDKHDKEIYEGDIIKWTGGLNLGNLEVFFNKKRGAWQYGDSPLLPIDMENCEIIGNRFENPDLLNIKN